MRRTSVKWNESEKDILKAHYLDFGPAGISDLLPGRTYKAISQMAHALGVSRKQSGPGSKLVHEGLVEEIRNRLLLGERKSHLASDYGVSSKTISCVVLDIPDIWAIRRSIDKRITKQIGTESSYFKCTEKRIEQFWANIHKEADTGCWIWGGNVHVISGYGIAAATRYKVDFVGSDYAHRVAFYLSRRRYPTTGMHIAHTCDNPPCINPIHLYEATPKENHQDAVARTGKQTGIRKLSDQDVGQIALMYKEPSDAKMLADKFGISRQYVYRIGMGISRRGVSDKL